jgi:hypothetical protein
LCFAESYDIFVAACLDRTVRRQFVTTVAAPSWNVSSQLAIRYIETRCPSITLRTSQTELGKVQIHINNNDDENVSRTVSNNFAQTNYSFRLMESIGVGKRENQHYWSVKPVLGKQLYYRTCYFM